MTKFVQVCVQTLTLGSLYALFALGIGLLFGANFSVGVNLLFDIARTGATALQHSQVPRTFTPMTRSHSSTGISSKFFRGCTS